MPSERVRALVHDKRPQTEVVTKVHLLRHRPEEETIHLHRQPLRPHNVQDVWVGSSELA